MPVSCKGKKNFDFQSTISDVKNHKNKTFNACPNMVYLRLKILSEMGVYERINNASASPDISHQ